MAVGGCDHRVIEAAGILYGVGAAGPREPGAASTVSITLDHLQRLFDGRIPQTLGQQLFLGFDRREKRGEAARRDGGLLRQLPPALLQLCRRQLQLLGRVAAENPVML